MNIITTITTKINNVVQNFIERHRTQRSSSIVFQYKMPITGSAQIPPHILQQQIFSEWITAQDFHFTYLNWINVLLPGGSLASSWRPCSVQWTNPHLHFHCDWKCRWNCNIYPPLFLVTLGKFILVRLIPGALGYYEPFTSEIISCDELCFPSWEVQPSNELVQIA